jgi:hypothetical protein
MMPLDDGQLDPPIGKLCRWQSAAIAGLAFVRPLGRQSARQGRAVFQLPQHSPPCRFAPFAAAALRRFERVRRASGTTVASLPGRADDGVK